MHTYTYVCVYLTCIHMCTYIHVYIHGCKTCHRWQYPVTQFIRRHLSGLLYMPIITQTYIHTHTHTHMCIRSKRAIEDDTSSLNLSDGTAPGPHRTPKIEDEDGDEAHPLLGQMRPVSYLYVYIYIYICIYILCSAYFLCTRAYILSYIHTYIHTYIHSYTRTEVEYETE